MRQATGRGRLLLLITAEFFFIVCGCSWSDVSSHHQLGPPSHAARGGMRALRLRGGQAENPWDTLDADDDELGGKQRLAPGERQKQLKRDRQRKKQGDAIDLEDPHLDLQGSQTLQQHMGYESSSEGIPNPDAPVDLAAMPHLPWEQPEDADMPGTRRTDGSKTSWDRERTGRDDDTFADAFDAADEDEPYRKSMRAEGEALTGDLIGDADALERLAIRGVRWNAINEWYEPLTHISALNESFPYWRALDKATARGDAGTVCKLLANLAAIEFASASVINSRLVKLVRKFVAHDSSLAVFPSFLSASAGDGGSASKDGVDSAERMGEGGGMNMWEDDGDQQRFFGKTMLTREGIAAKEVEEEEEEDEVNFSNM